MDLPTFQVILGVHPFHMPAQKDIRTKSTGLGNFQLFSLPVPLDKLHAVFDGFVAHEGLPSRRGVFEQMK